MSDIVLAKIGRGMASRVPYDAEIEYIENTSTQFIQTDFRINGTDQVYVKYLELDTTTYYPVVFSSRVGNNHTNTYTLLAPRFDYWDSTARVGFNMPARGHLTEFSFAYGKTIADNLEGYVNGEYKWRRLAVDFESAYNVSLFKGYQLSGQTLIGRIYRFTVKDKRGHLLHDLIPVRVGDVGCMYDRACPHGGPLGNGLYMNMGSGAFALGRDIRVNNLWKMPSKVVFMAGGPATVRTQNYFDDGVMWGAVASNGYTGSSGSASIGVLSITSAPSMYYPCAGVLKLKKSAKFRLTYDFSTKPINCAALLYKAVDGGYLFESSQAKVVPAGTTSIVFDFETKADTEYVVIPFYSSGSNVEQTVSNIVVYERK